MSKKYTVRDILKLRPCDEYNEEKLKSLLPSGKKSLSLAEIMELDFPDVDKIWIACRLLSKKSRCEFACDIAESVLPIFERENPADNRPRSAIEAMRKYLDGECNYYAATYAAVRAADAARAAADATDAAYAIAYAVDATARSAYVSFADSYAAACAAADAVARKYFYVDCVNLIILYAVMGEN